MGHSPQRKKKRRQSVFGLHCAGCPAGFTYLSAKTGGCYAVVKVNRNWNNAGLGCRSLHKDAHLLVINDAAEQSAVAGLASSTDCKWQYILLISTPIARSLLLFVVDSVCLSVCLSRSFKLFFFVSRWNRAVFDLQFSMWDSTKCCSSNFDLGPLTPKIDSPKCARNRL